MASYTPNLSLHQWEPEDAFLRQDFNQDFQKIDAAVAAAKVNPCCKYGTYEGNGSAVTVNVGFRPSFLVLISTYDVNMNAGDTVCTMGVSGLMVEHTRSYGSKIYRSCTFTDTGFTVSEKSAGCLNVDGVTYHYIAFY